MKKLGIVLAICILLCFVCLAFAENAVESDYTIKNTIEDIQQVTGIWVLKNVYTDQSLYQSDLLEIAGRITIDKDTVSLVIDNNETSFSVIVKDDVVCSEGNDIVLFQNSLGNLVYQISSDDEPVYLLFEREVSDSSALASRIKGAISSSESSKDNKSSTTDPINIQVVINNRQRSGSYTGEIINNVPNGNGIFESKDSLPRVMYDGNWKDGRMDGEGYLEDEGYQIHFSSNYEGEYDRTGTFKGTVINGVPNGEGYFLTKNSAGIPWSYTGQFTDGQFNGYGKQVWQEKDGLVLVGNYVNGNHSPTWSQAVQCIGGVYKFSVRSNSIEFIEKNSSIFKSSKLPNKNLYNNAWNIEDFKKHPEKQSNKLITLNDLYIIQVFSSGISDRDYEYCLMEDSNEIIYHGFFDASTDLQEDMRIKSISYLPLDWATYETVEGKKVWSVFGLCVPDYEAFTSITARIEVNDLYLRDRNGKAIASTRRGDYIEIIGYDPYSDMFLAQIGYFSGYIKGTGLSISRNELLKNFK